MFNTLTSKNMWAPPSISCTQDLKNVLKYLWKYRNTLPQLPEKLLCRRFSYCSMSLDFPLKSQQEPTKSSEDQTKSKRNGDNCLEIVCHRINLENLLQHIIFLLSIPFWIYLLEHISLTTTLLNIYKYRNQYRLKNKFTITSKN